MAVILSVRRDGIDCTLTLLTLTRYDPKNRFSLETASMLMLKAWLSLSILSMIDSTIHGLIEACIESLSHKMWRMYSKPLTLNRLGDRRNGWLAVISTTQLTYNKSNTYRHMIGQYVVRHSVLTIYILWYVTVNTRRRVSATQHSKVD